MEAYHLPPNTTSLHLTSTSYDLPHTVDVIHTDSRRSKTHQSIEGLVLPLVSVRQGIFVDITIYICIVITQVDSTLEVVYYEGMRALKMCAVGYQ